VKYRNIYSNQVDGAPAEVQRWHSIEPLQGNISTICLWVKPQKLDDQAHLIGCWHNLGAICFWQPVPSGLNLVVAAVLRNGLCVVSLLPCVADCLLYIVSKVERFVLTIIRPTAIIIIIIQVT